MYRFFSILTEEQGRVSFRLIHQTTPEIIAYLSCSISQLGHQTCIEIIKLYKIKSPVFFNRTANSSFYISTIHTVVCDLLFLHPSCSQWGPPELGNISSPVNYTFIFGKFTIFGAEKAPKWRTTLTEKDVHICYLHQDKLHEFSIEYLHFLLFCYWKQNAPKMRNYQIKYFYFCILFKTKLDI